MNCYYIDYENVLSGGLEGIEDLKKNDKVYLLYSQNANTMKMQIVEKLNKSKADVEFLDIKCLGQNALDFQLCVLMGSQIGHFRGTNLNVFIVSKDHGYDSVKNGVSDLLSETLKKRNISLSISRITTINGINIVKKEEDKRSKFLKIVSPNITNTKYSSKLNDIVNILVDTPSLTSIIFHNECVKKFGNKSGVEIYRLLKPKIQF